MQHVHTCRCLLQRPGHPVHLCSWAFGCWQQRLSQKDAGKICLQQLPRGLLPLQNMQKLCCAHLMSWPQTLGHMSHNPVLCLHRIYVTQYHICRVVPGTDNLFHSSVLLGALCLPSVHTAWAAFYAMSQNLNASLEFTRDCTCLI